jgi:hypothetical protein
MAAPKIDPTHKVPFTPLATDVFVRETVNVVRPTNEPIPEFGTPHDAISKSESWPHHKFCWQTAIDEKGNCERWFVADPEHQHLYNWQYTDAPDWPVVRQAFVIPRESFDPTYLAYEAPPSDVLDTSAFSVTGVEQTRIGEKQLDSLFVSVQVTREKIAGNPKLSYVLDQQTNEIRPVYEEKVPAGTTASPVNSNGVYTEVKAINTLWALKTTQFMAGLAGKQAPKRQEWSDVLNYSWPDVLESINFYTFPSSAGSIDSITGRPVYRRQRYDGPCEATITEEWSPTPPTPPTFTPMQPMEIQYSSPLLNINIPPCLHPGGSIYHTPGSNHPTLGFYFYEEFYPATTLRDWPEEYIASYTVRPAMGGYLSRKVTIKRPDGNLFDNILSLNSPTEGTAVSSFDLSWSMQNLVGTVSQYRLDVNTKADFTGTYLTGFKNLNRGTNTTATVTGLAPSVQYFARVRAIMAGGAPTVTSNTQILAAVPVARFQVSESSTVIADGGTLAFGNYVEGGASVVKTITVTNTGNVALTTLSRTLSGANASQWLLGGSPSTNLAVGASTTFTLAFKATSDGAKSAAVAIEYGNALATSVNLTGTGVAAVLPLSVSVDGTGIPDSGGFSFNAGGPYSVPVEITSNQEWTTLPFNSIAANNDSPGTAFSLSGTLPTSVGPGSVTAPFYLVFDDAGSLPYTGNLLIDYGTPSGTYSHLIYLDVLL